MKKIIKLVLVIVVIYFAVKGATYFTRENIYPKKHDDIITKISDKYDVEENLIYGIIKVESNFDEKITSKAGAKGLMQIMDETAIEVSNKIGIKDFEVDMLYEPETNIEIGVAYFSQLLNKYDNNEKYALIAYNAGQGNLDKWIQEKIVTDDVQSLYNIPFPETKAYWQKVLREYEAYNKIWGNE